MSTSEQSSQLQLRRAMESGDLHAAVDAFAPDAVLRSPFTDRLSFTGRQQIGLVTEVVLEVFKDLRYTHELAGDDGGFLVGRARVGGQDLEWVDHLQLDADGKIRELTLFFRPLPGTAAALRVIGAGLAMRGSPARAAAISAFAAPLGVMARAGDRIGVALIESSMHGSGGDGAMYTR